MANAITSLYGSCLLILVGTALQAQGEPIVRSHQGARPVANEESHVVQGEAVYSEFDYVTQSAAVLLEPVVVGPRKRLAAGEVLLGFDSKRQGRRYCKLDEDHRTLGMREATWVCLVPGPTNDTFVSRYLLAQGAVLGRRKKLSKEAQFRITDVPLPTERASEVSGRRMFRNEIVFQGAAGGILRFLYREFGNDMARPAFSQELTYDFPGDGSLEVAVKGARLEILDAGNAGLRYRILRGFE